MHRRLNQQRGLLFLIAAALGSPGVARAGKVDLMLGYFYLAATSATRSGSVSAIGAARLAYRHPILDSLELGIGYTVVTSKITGGDLGYGVDLGAQYYPLTDCCAHQSRLQDASVGSFEIWRPYVAAGFHQRQFQSVQSSYPGIGGAVGTEYAFSPTFGLRGEVRWIQLFGNSVSSATELTGTAGITVGF